MKGNPNNGAGVGGGGSPDKETGRRLGGIHGLDSQMAIFSYFCIAEVET